MPPTPLRLPPDLGDLATPPGGAAQFDGALRLFGTRDGDLPSLARWNDHGAWRKDYGDLTVGLTFFAEDAFGNQFAWDAVNVVQFAAETGAREVVAPSAAAWADLTANDQDRWLIRWLYEEWVASNGRPTPQDHLAPKVPFTLGTKPDASELFVVDRWSDMIFKGSIAQQLKDVTPGSRVRLIARD